MAENKNKKQKQNKRKNRFNELIDKEDEAIQEEINKLREQIEMMTGEEAPVIKVVNPQRISPKKYFLYVLLKMVLSIIILASLSGFIEWMDFNNILFALLTIISIVLVETILMVIINRFCIRWIFFTFGLINLVPVIISFVLAYNFAYNVSFPNVGKMILVAFLYIIIRKIVLRVMNSDDTRFLRS